MKIKTLPINIISILFSMPVFADETWKTSLLECSAKLEQRTVESDVAIVRSDCPLSLEEGIRSLFPDHTLPIHGIYLAG